MQLIEQLRTEIMQLGQTIACSGHTPYLLNDPQQVCFVAAGMVNVFAVDLELNNRREPIMQMGSGQLLFAASNQTHTLLAVGNTDTQLCIFPLANLAELLQNQAYQTLLTKLIEQWLSDLTVKLTRSPMPASTLILEKDQSVKLSLSQTLASTQECQWFKIIEGSVSYAQHQQSLTDSMPTLYPFLQPSWLCAQSESVKLEFQPTLEVIKRPEFLNSLLNFNGLVLDEITQAFTEQVKLQTQRYEIKQQGDAAAIKNAFKKMQSILKPNKVKAVIDTSSYSPLTKACQLVAKAQGMVIEPSPSTIASHDLTDIVNTAGIQMRQVELDKNWWRQNGGSLLVFRGSERNPCAALQTKPNQYLLIDPITDNSEIIDGSHTEEISPIAYTFYCPFPQQEMKGKALLKFSLRGNLPEISNTLLSGILAGLLAMLTPIFTGTLFDRIIPNAEKYQLLQVVIALITAGFALGLFQLVRVFAIIRLSSKTNLRLEAALWDRLLRLPMPFFKRYNTGDLTMRALAISSIRQVFTGITISAVLSALFSIFSFGLLFYYSWQLALLATSLVLIIALVTLGLSIWQIHYQRTLQNLNGKVTGLLLQLINGVAKLQSAGRENKAFSIWAEQFSEQKHFSYKARFLSNSLLTFNAFFLPIMSLAIYAVIAFKIKDLAIGNFIAFSAAFGQFIGSILTMTSTITQSLMVIPLFERAKPILTELPETGQTKTDPGKLRGDIEFNHVSFRYAENGPQILKDVSLKIKSGQFVAFVGKSGAGKSTLLRLMLGFEQPGSGSIFIDGKDITQLNLQKFRKQLGVVLQNSALISDSIFRNIVGSAPLTLDDAWQAAQLAGFAEDIKAMPMGMHTVLAEGAKTISGGQKQRLMIARALAQKPRVLLFDEATSALDNRTQAIVSQSLEKLHITRIVIAHRLSTIANADLIFVVDNGEIVQHGSYQELAKQPGIFAELIKRQTL